LDRRVTAAVSTPGRAALRHTPANGVSPCPGGLGLGFREYVLLGTCIIAGQVDIVRTGSRTDLEVVDDVHVCELWCESSSAPAFTTPKQQQQSA
jgi:hypothetical protein